MASDMSRSKTTTIQKNDGRYAYETKRPLQLCWLATSGTQEVRIRFPLNNVKHIPIFPISHGFLLLSQLLPLFLKGANYLL